MEQVKRLKTEFIGRGEVKGVPFRQINRTDWGFIYERNDGGTITYEVFRKRINKRFATESYPTSKSFGVWAWSKSTLQSAQDKLMEIKPNE